MSISTPNELPDIPYHENEDSVSVAMFPMSGASESIGLLSFAYREQQMKVVMPFFESALDGVEFVMKIDSGPMLVNLVSLLPWGATTLGVIVPDMGCVSEGLAAGIIARENLPEISYVIATDDSEWDFLRFNEH